MCNFCPCQTKKGILQRKTKDQNLLKIFVSCIFFNPLKANPTKWSNILKQFVGNLPTNCLSVFGHFAKSAIKGLKSLSL